jgi:hypothetical protein
MASSTANGRKTCRGLRSYAGGERSARFFNSRKVGPARFSEELPQRCGNDEVPVGFEGHQFAYEHAIARTAHVIEHVQCRVMAVELRFNRFDARGVFDAFLAQGIDAASRNSSHLGELVLNGIARAASQLSDPAAANEKRSGLASPFNQAKSCGAAQCLSGSRVKRPRNRTRTSASSPGGISTPLVTTCRRNACSLRLQSNRLPLPVQE